MSAKKISMQICPKITEKEVHVVHLPGSPYRAVLVGRDESDIWHGVLHSLGEQPACDVLQHLALLIPCNAHAGPRGHLQVACRDALDVHSYPSCWLGEGGMHRSPLLDICMWYNMTVCLAGMQLP